MVTGESGTGKEMVARAIHYESGRAGKAFVTDQLRRRPRYPPGSRTLRPQARHFTGAVEDRVGLFQQADGGTLFLDEIGETSPAFQVKLLRVLREGEFRPLGSSRSVTVDVRVIAATNRDLEEEVRAGRFREDLYYRLATIAIHVPPCATRPMDIPLQPSASSTPAAAPWAKPWTGSTAEALACIAAYRWPGNVRELHNEILRMVAWPTARNSAPTCSPPASCTTPVGDTPEELAWLAGLSGGLKDAWTNF